MVPIKTFLKTWKPVRNPEASLLETRERKTKEIEPMSFLPFSGNRTDNFKRRDRVHGRFSSK